MKSILVPMLGGKNDLAALEAAHSVARAFDSHIEGLHVRPNVVERGVTLTLGAGDYADNFWTELENEIKRNAEAAHRNFQSFRERAHIHLAQVPGFVSGATAGWREVEGRTVEMVVHRSRYHDLTILPRADDYYGFMAADMGEVLMRSGRPILLVPSSQTATSLKTVCVAWKDTAEAARALTAAVPLIEKASKVIIVGVVEEEKRDDVMASLNHIADALRWRAIEPEVSCLATVNQSATLELLDFTNKAGADLLVMGGYGHSRAREFLFGGMTSEILDMGDIPVLLAH